MPWAEALWFQRCVPLNAAAWACSHRSSDSDSHSWKFTSRKRARKFGSSAETLRNWKNNLLFIEHIVERYDNDLARFGSHSFFFCVWFRSLGLLERMVCRPNCCLHLFSPIIFCFQYLRDLQSRKKAKSAQCWATKTHTLQFFGSGWTRSSSWCMSLRCETLELSTYEDRKNRIVTLSSRWKVWKDSPIVENRHWKSDPCNLNFTHHV